MSVGSNLQEMENVVTKGAKPAEPMPKLDLDTQVNQVLKISAVLPQKIIVPMTIQQNSRILLQL